MKNRTEVSAAAVDVTPEMAGTWLANNPGNRAIIRARVDHYAALMKAGAWALNGETIVLGPGGELLDGQHRLSAVVAAGVPVPMLVASGVALAARPTIDIGKSRSLPHIVSMMCADEISVINVTAWAKLHARLLGRNPSELSFDEWTAWRAQNATGIEWVRDEYYNKAHGALRTAPVCGSLVFAYRKAPMKVREFAAQLRDGEGLRAGWPAHTIIKWFIDQPPVMRRDGAAVARRILSAAHAHVLGEVMRVSQVGDRGLVYFARAHGVNLGRLHAPDRERVAAGKDGAQ